MIGKARRLKPFDNVNTDYVISGRYKFRIQDPRELAKYIFEDIDVNFARKVQKGDFVVAGDNFGCGSSREQAPQALKASEISAVLAKSFARIFYRNSFNIGLLLVECDTSRIRDKDRLMLNLKAGRIKNITGKYDIIVKPTPYVMQRLLNDGGVVAHFRKHGGFKIVS